MVNCLAPAARAARGGERTAAGATSASDKGASASVHYTAIVLSGVRLHIARVWECDNRCIKHIKGNQRNPFNPTQVWLLASNDGPVRRTGRRRIYTPSGQWCIPSIPLSYFQWFG